MRRLQERFIELLRWSEPYTKTDMVYAASGGFWTTWIQVVMAICSIPLSIAFANLLLPNDYGIYRYVLTVAGLLGALSLTALPLALVRAAARGFDGSLKSAFAFNLRWSGLLVAVALIGAGYYFLRGNSLLAGAMLLIAICTPWLNSGGLFSAFLNGKRLFRISAKYSNRRTFIHTVLILGTLYIYPDPLAVLFVYFSSQTATALYYYRKTLQNFVKDDAVDPEMSNFGKHMSFINVFATLADRIDALLLFQHIGAVELAVYSFAEMVPDLMNRFNKSISALALPKFAVRENRNGVWSKTILISLILLPGALLYIALAPYLFSLFFPAYMASVPYTQALALLALINTTLPSTYIDAQGAIKARYIISMSTNAVRLFAVGTGVIFFGIWGAIAGRYFSRIFSVILVAIVFRRLR